MTRQQFIDEVTTWQELIEWCLSYGCSYCDDIYSDASRDEYINEDLMDMARNYSWYELKERLCDLETGYDYWRRDDYGDWYGVDDEFDDYFSDVLNWADENCEFDEEEEFMPEEVSYSTPDDESDEFEADTDVSLNAFFVSNAEELDKIIAETETTEIKANFDFDKFVHNFTQACVTTVGDY